jgi:hypothetical protein
MSEPSPEPNALWPGVFFTGIRRFHCHALGTAAVFTTAWEAAQAQQRNSPKRRRPNLGRPRRST